MDDDLTTPDLTDIPVDDNAEPRDAETLHRASVDDVGGLDTPEPEPVPDQTPSKADEPDPVPAEKVEPAPAPKKTTQKGRKR